MSSHILAIHFAIVDVASFGYENVFTYSIDDQKRQWNVCFQEEWDYDAIFDGVRTMSNKKILSFFCSAHR